LATNRKAPKATDDLVDWFTVTYKSIYTVLGIVLALAAAAEYGLKAAKVVAAR